MMLELIILRNQSQRTEIYDSFCYLKIFPHLCLLCLSFQEVTLHAYTSPGFSQNWRDHTASIRSHQEHPHTSPGSSQSSREHTASIRSHQGHLHTSPGSSQSSGEHTTSIRSQLERRVGGKLSLREYPCASLGSQRGSTKVCGNKLCSYS